MLQIIAVEVANVANLTTSGGLDACLVGNQSPNRLQPCGLSNWRCSLPCGLHRTQVSVKVMITETVLSLRTNKSPHPKVEAHAQSSIPDPNATQSPLEGEVAEPTN